MRATLFVLPASHPAYTARLMLERKGIEYRRIDLAPAVHRAVLKALGFPGVTVPALVLDGARLQGTRRISRALDALQPEPPLFPSDSGAREQVEQAELWGDEVYQPAVRRIAWGVLTRDSSTVETFLEDARLGIPNSLAAATMPPIAWLSAKLNRATDDQVRADLRALPGMLDRVDDLIERGVIGGADLNAADYQIATSTRLLLTMEDVRGRIEDRAAGLHARRVVPRFPGSMPAALPTDWLRA